MPFEHKTSVGNASTAESVRHLAENRLGRTVRLFRAPGRVNLIGEHTDYNDGFVLPAAIRFAAWAGAVVRDDRRVMVSSQNFDETREFDLDRLPASLEHHWSDYVAGVITELVSAGVPLAGADLIISGDVPLGSGLSSSAALETVVALALIALADARVDRTQLALLCQRAERDFVGVRVGIMDQFISSHARAGNALLLDCRSLDYRFAPMPAGASLVIGNTMVHHTLAGSEYNRRREQCEEGVAILARHLPRVKALRDVELADLERFAGELDSVVYRRCRHVITENRRVLDAVRALDSEDLTRFGQLMYDSHRSLRDDYEVSCRELDVMVEIASTLPGLYGARMTGGGFGGCTVNLVAKDYAERVREGLFTRYRELTRIKPAIYVTDTADGAEEILTA